MDTFTPLERLSLDAIIDEMTEARATVECQLSHAKVVSRENTGGGFFVDVETAADVPLLPRETASLGQNVWMGIRGLEYGLGVILHHKAGLIHLLEGYSPAGENTSPIDFSQVRFAIIKEPGPLTSDGS